MLCQTTEMITTLCQEMGVTTLELKKQVGHETVGLPVPQTLALKFVVMQRDLQEM